VKVWLLIWQQWESWSIRGIYTTLELAQAQEPEETWELKRWGTGGFISASEDYTIEQFEVKDN
jgi:hypothetical protein